MTRSFWVRPIAGLFFTAVLVAGAWHGSRSADDTLARFDPPQMREDIARDAWWRTGWEQLPTRRNEFRSRSAWPLNVQYAGPLSSLRARLESRGWTPGGSTGWDGLLRTLDADADAANLPVLPASHNGRPDALLMTRPGREDGTREVLHLWPSPLRLQPGDVPVWQGTVATVRLTRRLGLFTYWQMEPSHADALDGLSRALPELRRRRDARTARGETVLLLQPR